MGIYQKATEFADCPVVEYSPTTGVVLPVMPRLELRTPDDSDQFWAISLERERLTIESGKVRTGGQTETLTFPDLVAAQARYRELVLDRIHAGFGRYVRRELHLAGEPPQFWTATVAGTLRTITSGEAGTPGKVIASRQFRSENTALADCEILVAEKMMEGYVEKKPDAGDLRGALMAALRDNPDDVVSRSALLDYLTEQGEGPPQVAYRVEGGEFGSGDGLARLETFLADPAACLVRALVIGALWSVDDADQSPAHLIEALVKAAGRLPNLRGLFLGDILRQECEISWITQSDLTPLFTAFPRLEHFRSRGGNELALKPFRHERLKSLVIEASNLSRKVVRALGECDLPALEHLELWLGTSEYGADTTPADLAEILQGERLPSLRYLGLRNSEIADALPAALAGAPTLERLRVLDLSLGNLSDEGAEALLAIPGLARLEKLELHHHYVTPPLIARLRSLGIEVGAGDAREPEFIDEDEPAYRFVTHSE